MVILSFCFIELHFLCNYHGMGVNYRNILTPKSRVKIIAVIYCGVVLKHWPLKCALSFNEKSFGLNGFRALKQTDSDKRYDVTHSLST